jgi:predicted phosphate transport protein (TIGR00153 family)
MKVMKVRLVPQERAFFDLFRQDIATCKAGVDILCAMLRDYRDLKRQAERMREIEHEGDRITSEIFALLNRTFVTPFEREDLIMLGSIIDTVLDQVDEVANMLVLYGIERPSPYLLEASTLLSRAVDELVAAIGKLESFKGIAPHVAEVHRLETEADDLYYNALADLFAPDAYTPLEVIKWNRLYDLMERAFDKCEDVGNALQNVVLKNG